MPTLAELAKTGAGVLDVTVRLRPSHPAHEPEERLSPQRRARTHMANGRALGRTAVPRLQLPDDGKAARTAFYELLRAAYPSVDGATVEEDGRKVLRLSMRSGAGAACIGAHRRPS